MPWAERSFFVEIKPQAEYASLYVSCVEDDSRDIVRIVQNGIDLCSSNELCNNDSAAVTDMVLEKLTGVRLIEDDDPLNNDKGNGEQQQKEKTNGAQNDDVISKSSECQQNPQNQQKQQQQKLQEPLLQPLSAVIKGLRMDPESVKNYSWAEDQQTFACKLKVDLVNNDNEPRSWNEAMKYVKMSVSGLESYCDKMNDCSILIQCGKCGKVFHRDNHLQSLKYFKLPSVEFNEIMDELFCHQHERGAFDNNIMYSYFVNGPKVNQCFVNNTYLLLNADVVEGCQVNDTNTLTCNDCHQHIGCLDISPSSRFFPKKNAYRLYHVCTKVYAKNKDDPAASSFDRNFFNIRYETKEQYFSWLILSECESYSTLYFVIRTLDYRPRLMIWTLDPFTIMAVGRLADKQLEAVANFKPFPAVKLLYRRLNHNDLNDPFVNGQHTGVAPLYLPISACEMLLDFLDASSDELPLNCRKLGNFQVGFLPTASEF